MLSSMRVSPPHTLSVIVTPIIQVFAKWEWEEDGKECKGQGKIETPTHFHLPQNSIQINCIIMKI